MSYAQKPTLAEELQGRLGDALGRWTKGLRRIFFRSRTVAILEIPAGKDRLRPARMSVIPKADAYPQVDRKRNAAPPPLP